jgi:hypothetical protein
MGMMLDQRCLSENATAAVTNMIVALEKSPALSVWREDAQRLGLDRRDLNLG